jgi:cytochrome P450 family 142 subfamily A polypeptide 1
MTTPPPELSIGLADGTFYSGDPFPAFAWMREHAPAYFDVTSGVWGITRYADVKEISKDPDTFSNAGGIRPDGDALPMMIETDAPEHVRRRRLVSEGFTPGASVTVKRASVASATASSTGSARPDRPTSFAISPHPCP